MASSDEIHIPLRIDIDQATEDLATVDREAQRLQTRLTQLYNQTSAVRTGRANPAQGIQDIPTNAYTPGMQATAQRLDERVTQLRRQVEGGKFTPPPTAQEVEQAAAAARLKQAGRQNMKPLEIVFSDQGLRKFTDAFKAMGPSAIMSAASGDLGGVSRTFLRGLMGSGGVAAGAIGGLGIAALAGSDAAASMARQNAFLASNLIGGPSGSVPQGLALVGNEFAGAGLGASTDQTRSLLSMFAAGGVDSKSTDSLMRSTITASRTLGLDPTALGPLATTLSTTGGLNANQVKDTFTDLTNSLKDTKVPATELVNALQAAGPSAGALARNLGGLAAVQAALGTKSGVNAGAVLAPFLNSSGIQAMQQGQLLGYKSTDAFLAARKTPSGATDIYNRTAGYLRSFGDRSFEAQIAQSQFGINLQGDAMYNYIDAVNSGRRANPADFAAKLHYDRAHPRAAPRQGIPDKIGNFGHAAWDWMWTPGSNDQLMGAIGSAPGNLAGGTGNLVGGGFDAFGRAVGGAKQGVGNGVGSALRDIGDGLTGFITVQVVDHNNNPMAPPHIVRTRLQKGTHTYHKP